MTSQGQYIGKGVSWIKDNPLVGVLVIFSMCMTGGSAIGSVISIYYGMQQQASVLANIAAAFATLLLVGITASYAIFTQEMVRQSRIERMRPHIISLISQGIDEMLTEIEQDEDELEVVEFHSDIPEFCDFRWRRHEEEVLADLKDIDGEVMDQWQSYRETKSNYLDVREETERELTHLVEEEFIKNYEELQYTDFLPQGADEDDLRSGMINSDGGIQEMLKRNGNMLANRILVNDDLPSFEHKNFVGENEIIHRVFIRHRDELLEYRNRTGINDSLDELQTIIRKLSTNIAETKSKLKRLRSELKSGYDIPETRIQNSDLNGYPY